MVQTVNLTHQKKGKKSSFVEMSMMNYGRKMMEGYKSKTLILENIQMMTMLEELKPILTHRDKLGYFAARNSRTLSNELVEYISFRNQLIQKYGRPIEHTNQIQIQVNDENWSSFCSEIEEFDHIKHEIQLYVCKYEDVIGHLTGEEILAIDWMLEDG